MHIVGFNMAALIAGLVCVGSLLAGGAMALLGLLIGRPGIAFMGCGLAIAPWMVVGWLVA